MNTLIQTLPTRLRKRGQKLLQFLAGQPDVKYDAQNDVISFGPNRLDEEKFTQILQNLLDMNRLITPATISAYENMRQHFIVGAPAPVVFNPALLFTAAHPAFQEIEEEEEDKTLKIKPVRQSKRLMAKANLNRAYQTRPITNQWKSHPF